jgi:16S rRNA (adenine1518-N6/adenine1519-N6)-dimethyltransferase
MFKKYKKYQENNFHKPVRKKKFGQHFLRDQSIVDNMISKVNITDQTFVLEIGCGDGFLTSSILSQTKCKQLWGYEIDPEWASFVKKKIHDTRLVIKKQDILSVDFEKELVSHVPWVLLANLPYQITFPLLFLIAKHKNLFSEGVIMIQEEVAQKILATHGRTFSPTSMFLQYNFYLELLDKVPPESFEPAPKIFSRTVYFKPKFNTQEIKNEDEFWNFLKLCFKFPRQTLRNNLKSTKYLELFPEIFTQELLRLRAQQMSFDDFKKIWAKIINF